MKRKMLSIIIPVLNEAKNLERLLPYIRAICPPEAEVIVVDGGSEDETRAVAPRFPWVKWVSSGRGRARQMNAGAKLAKGDAIVFLHADTLLPGGAQPAILGAFADSSLVGGRFDVGFDNPRLVFKLIAALMNLRSRLSGICTGDQAIFVKREVFEALGGYPEIPLMEDVELTRRLKRKGRLACLSLQVTTSARKWEQEGAVKTILLMWTIRLLYFLGVGPERLHQWYYRSLPSSGRGESGGSSPELSALSVRE